MSKIFVLSSVLDSTGCIHVDTNENVDIIEIIFYNITIDVALKAKTTRNVLIDRCCFYMYIYDMKGIIHGNTIIVESSENTTYSQSTLTLFRQILTSANNFYNTYLIGSGLFIINSNYSKNSAIYGCGPLMTANVCGLAKYLSITDYFVSNSVALYIYNSLINFEISHMIIAHGTSGNNNYGALCMSGSTTTMVTDSFMIDLINSRYIGNSGNFFLKRSYFSFQKSSYASTYITFDNCSFNLQINIQPYIEFDLLNTHLCNRFGDNCGGKNSAHRMAYFKEVSLVVPFLSDMKV